MADHTKYFFLEEHPINKGTYSISMNFEKLPLRYTTGSYALLPARVLNLTYAEYLRFCRDVIGAEIIGKGSYYPVAYFKRNDATVQFVELLNARLRLIFYELEHPNWEAKQAELETIKI